MDAQVVLPAIFSHAVILWLYELTPEPLLRLAAGREMADIVSWYSRILMSTELWQKRVTELKKLTTDRVWFCGIENQAMLCYYPYEQAEEIIVPLSDVLQHVQSIGRCYRRDIAARLTTDVGLPKWLRELVCRADDTDNYVRLQVLTNEPVYRRLMAIVEAAEEEQRHKRDKKLIKLGLPLHRLRKPNALLTGRAELTLRFDNELRMEFYGFGYYTNRDMIIEIAVPGNKAAEAIKTDLFNLKLPDPPKLGKHGQIQLF